MKTSLEYFAVQFGAYLTASCTSSRFRAMDGFAARTRTRSRSRRTIYTLAPTGTTLTLHSSGPRTVRTPRDTLTLGRPQDHDAGVGWSCPAEETP